MTHSRSREGYIVTVLGFDPDGVQYHGIWVGGTQSLPVGQYA